MTDPYALHLEIKTSEYLNTEIKRLRQVAKLDRQVYARLKTRLPYFCCAQYKNGIRITEDFAQIAYFVIDIDKLPGKEQLQEVMSRLRNDSRVMMLFVSPGGNGCKVLFMLQKPFDSLQAFTHFYKTFCYRFAEEYQIAAYLDTATCDATRACFLSYDPEVYFFALADEINADDYVSVMIAAAADIERMPAATVTKELTATAIAEETYQDIRKLLNPDAKPPQVKAKQVFQPEILQTLVKPIEELALHCGLQVKEIQDIHYGKKVVMQKGFKSAEVNIYYGKQGFTVYKTPKNGSDPVLGDVVKELVEQVIYQ